MMNEIKALTLNFGPVQPAAHGVLRLILSLNGEKIQNVEPHIGLLHRGTEKLIETKSYMQGLPYLNRLDYTSTISNEHSYVLAVEKLMNIKVSDRSSNIRIIMLEITRILNHLLAVSCHALDVGAMTGYFWCFDEREKLLEFYERVSGARMHSAYFRFGGLKSDIPIGMLSDIYKFCESFIVRLDEIDEILSENRIWKNRLKGIGVISLKQALNLGFTGVMLRGSGLCYDVRVNMPYENYDKIKFNVPVGRNGDCYDRYKVRMAEMRESVSIILQAINMLKAGNINTLNIDRQKMKTSMSSLIKHFKHASDGMKVSAGECYVGTESPKGEFGVYIVADGSSKPYRVKFRSPSMLHLSGLNKLVKGSQLADMVTVLGTIDIVFGEIDR